MELLVDRITSDDDATLSVVSIDSVFESFGLEDEYREDKIAGETRIPAGRYKVTLRTIGGFNARYTKKFPDFHKGMLWVRDVPNFEYILIHIGNTEENTAGCLLVGQGAMTSGELRITHSSLAYKQLYCKVVEAAANDDLWITYQDSDRKVAQ